MIQDIRDITLDMLDTTWPMLVISCLVAMVLRITYLVINGKKFVLYEELLKLFFIIYILCLFQIVTAQDVSFGGVNIIPFKEIFRYDIGSHKFFRNVMGNIMLFIPFGFLSSYLLKNRKLGVVTILTIIASLTIEVVQYYIGRVFDIDDIILNLVGGIVGFLIYVGLDAIRNKIKLFKNDTILDILIIIILLILSAYFSSAETALTTVNKIRMRSLAEENSKAAKRVLKLIEEPSKMLSAVLICNNIVNLSASSISTSYAFSICKRIGMENSTSLFAGIATGILTVLILIFGEITPKNLATKNAEKLALFYSSSISAITHILTPVIFIVNQFARFLMFLLRVDTSKKSSSITEDELRTFVDVSHEEGVIESEERKMITNIVDFGDTLAKDVMIPRMDIAMVEANISYDELLTEFTENKYARLPVYEETIDHIIGIINLKDFVFYQGDKENLNIKSLMREAHVTYEYKNVSELFMEMRKDSIPMTIVLDEYGALAGLITMEDLIEEIVGELRDEYDTDEEDDIQVLSDSVYKVLGSTPLDDIAEALGVPLKSDDYDSIAGHVINLLEHFPTEGETAEDEFARYTVLKVDGNRIDTVKLELKPKITEEPEEAE